MECCSSIRVLVLSVCLSVPVSKCFGLRLLQPDCEQIGYDQKNKFIRKIEDIWHYAAATWNGHCWHERVYMAKFPACLRVEGCWKVETEMTR